MSFCLFHQKISFCIVRFLPLALLVSGCQLGDPYHRPYAEVPHTWKTSPNWENSPNEACPESDSPSGTTCCWQQPCPRDKIDRWWEIFNDPVLNRLEEQAISSSYTILSAIERITQARALARIDAAERWPLITFNPSFTRNGRLIVSEAGAGRPVQGISASPISLSDLPPDIANMFPAEIPLPPTEIRVQSPSYQLPFNFSYEVDLWNRITNTYLASLLRADVALEEYLNVLLSLTADIAANYFQLRGLDTQQVVLQENIQIREQALTINTARFRAGLVIYSDVTQAEEQLALAKADSANIARLRGLQEDLIALLVGVPASIFSLDFNPIPLESTPPVIPLGLPSELLYRRPNIAQAERNLAAAHADIRVADAAFYPSLRLVATLGLASPNTSSLFTWSARLWDFGFNIMQTIFNAGLNSANLLNFLSRYREALNNYEQQVLIAFQETEDALINLKQQALREEQLKVAVRASRITLNLTQLRYTQGLVNYLEVFDVQRNVLINEQNVAITLAQRYLDTVTLIRALGGSWGDLDCLCDNEKL